MISTAIKLIDESLASHTILVSDAIIALNKLIYKIATNNSLEPAGAVDYFVLAAQSLNKELLGYDEPDWNLKSPYRQCKADIVRKTVAGDVNTYKYESTQTFVAVWGAQQIETHLCEVMDMSVFAKGDEQLIAQEVKTLSQTNHIRYTESDLSPDLWLRFSVLEMVRIYFEMKSVMRAVCSVLIQALELQPAHVFDADFNRALVIDSAAPPN